MLTQIEIENIDSILLDISNNRQKFNNEIFKLLLENSCYYPASGTDTTPIKYLEKIQSFIYCDYIYDVDRWTNQIIKEMDNYELIFQEKLNISKTFDKHFFIRQHERSKKIRLEISELKNLINELHKSENNESLIQEKYHEINQLEAELYDLKDRRTNNNLLESLLERTNQFSHITIWEKNGKYLSIIYISAEAVHCYEQIFPKNKVTPKVISIIQPGHTMGGNWTNFFDIRSEFLQAVHKGPLPKYLLIGSYGNVNHRYQIFYDQCNFEEVFESRRTVRDSISKDGHYVYIVKNKENTRLDLANKTKIYELDLLLKTVIFEDWCLSINCHHCNNWNIRSVLTKLKPEELVQSIKLFSDEFLDTNDKLFRFLMHEIENFENGNELTQLLYGTPSYLKFKENIETDKRQAEEDLRINLIRQEAENERKRLLKIAATPEAIAERKVIRKQLREIKTFPQRNKKQLTALIIRDFIEKISQKSDSELLKFVISSENKISMKASGGIVYERLLNFFKSNEISNADRYLLIKLAAEHSWHWKKLYKNLS